MMGLIPARSFGNLRFRPNDGLQRQEEEFDCASRCGFVIAQMTRA
jgi:hypothetical protein